MAYLIGVALALLVYLFANRVGLDRDRAFYPTVLVVVALLYNLFAVMGGSLEALMAEMAGAAVFIAFVVLGFRRNLWFAVAGLAGHGVYDLLHPHLIANPGVPAWWPAFCLAYDVAAAAGLAWLLHQRPGQAKPTATQ